MLVEPVLGVCALSAWLSQSLSHLQLVPWGHQSDRRGDAAAAVQRGQLPGAQQRDQQERFLPLLEVSEPGWGGGGGVAGDCWSVTAGAPCHRVPVLMG